MKKIYVVIVLLLTAISFANAQAFNKGDNAIGIGVGIGGHYSAYGSYSTQTPAIGLWYEHGSQLDVGPGVLGFGAYVGYKSLSYREAYYSNYNYDWTWTYIILGFRAAYHYDVFKAPKLDTYAGLMLSYNIETFKDNTTYYGNFHNAYATGGSYVGVSMFLGARYYFSPKVAAFAELGYGIAVLNVGVDFKFGK
jgi:hypothetical protein